MSEEQTAGREMKHIQILGAMSKLAQAVSRLESLRSKIAPQPEARIGSAEDKEQVTLGAFLDSAPNKINALAERIETETAAIEALLF